MWEKRFNLFLLLNITSFILYYLASLIYILSVKILIIFFIVYILPGTLLILNLKNKNDFKQLLVEGFFISLILNICISLLIMSLNLDFIYFNIVTCFLILNCLLSIRILLYGNEINIIYNKIDIIIIGILFLIFFVIFNLLFYYYRYFTPDETIYIEYIRYALTENNLYPVSTYLFSTEFSVLFNGRLLWIVFSASFLGISNLLPYQIGLMSLLFLPIIAILSILFIPKDIINYKVISFFTPLLIMTCPILFLFSGFILNDLCICFLLMYTIYHFLNSIEEENKKIIKFNITELFISLISIFIIILIKPNLVVFGTIYLLIISTFLRNKHLLKIKSQKILFYFLVIPVIFYELFIDLPYFITYWFLKNSYIAIFLHKFLVISPIEWITSTFLFFDPNTTPLFKQDFLNFLNFLYRYISPESINIFGSSIILILPLFIFVKNITIKRKYLYIINFLTFIFYYLFLLSHNDIYSLVRLGMVIYPLTIISFILIINQFNMNILIYNIISIFSIIIIHISYFLIICNKGTLIGFGLLKDVFTINIIVFQLIIFMVSIIFLKYIKNIGNNLKYFIIIICLVSITSNIFFSNYFITNSYFYQDKNINNISEFFVQDQQSLICTNIYHQLNVYLPDSYLQNHQIISLPYNETQFLKMIRVLPNNTLLVLTSDRDLGYLEYANKDTYIYKYTSLNKIPIGLKMNRIVSMEKIKLFVKYNYSDKKYYNYTNVKIVKCPDNNTFSAKTYLEIEHQNYLNINNDISIECIFNTSIKRGFLVQKSLGGYGGYVLGFTPDGNLFFEIRDEARGSMLYGPKPSDSQHHVVVTCKLENDKSKVVMYLDGKKVSEDNLSRKLEMSKNKENLKIGVNDWFKGDKFIGEINEVEIYNKTLTTDEILNMYYGPIKIWDNGKISIFRDDTNYKKINFNVNTNFTMKDISFNWLNTTSIKFSFKINSINDENVTMYLDCGDFLEQYSLNVKTGETLFEFTVPERLKNGFGYGSYMANWSNIIVLDKDNQVIFHNIIVPFHISQNNLYVWSFLFIIIILIYLLFYKNIQF